MNTKKAGSLMGIEEYTRLEKHAVAENEAAKGQEFQLRNMQEQSDEEEQK